MKLPHAALVLLARLPALCETHSLKILQQQQLMEQGANLNSKASSPIIGDRAEKENADRKAVGVYSSGSRMHVERSVCLGNDQDFVDWR